MADEFDDKVLKGTLNAWRESAEKQSERPDWFWARQRALISSHVQQTQPRRMPTLAWAGIAATVAVGIALILPGQKTPPAPEVALKHASAVETAAATTTSDSDLMQEVEETMNSGVPDSLQPASTLQQAMEKAYSGTTAKKTKENMQ